ncbi:hypothetical protein MBLL_04221 [Methylobacterium bullatum]|uniref:Uncharacterized protein n=1 Tax=Methylobacterium bullatum TaxID=570505 RepID=A0A679JZM9_9HYPH|nr:hypothetical protein MBLL_04221 [Methylobacterium bullatum]
MDYDRATSYWSLGLSKDGATCPEKGKGAGLVMPRCDTPAMNEHLAETTRAADTDRTPC